MFTFNEGQSGWTNIVESTCVHAYTEVHVHAHARTQREIELRDSVMSFSSRDGDFTFSAESGDEFIVADFVVWSFSHPSSALLMK